MKFGKILIVLTIIFLSRLLFSCCNCPKTAESANLNMIELEYLNLIPNEQNLEYSSDSMLNASVAFEIIVRDSTEAKNNWYVNNAGFSSASAFQPCECPKLFLPDEQISSIKINTLKDINSKIKSGQEISGLFVAKNRNTFLYLEIEDLLKSMKGSVTSGLPGYRVAVYLKEKIDNSEAQFEVSVTLSNSKVLKMKTKVIKITSPETLN